MGMTSDQLLFHLSGNNLNLSGKLGFSGFLEDVLRVFVKRLEMRSLFVVEPGSPCRGLCHFHHHLFALQGARVVDIKGRGPTKLFLTQLELPI